MSSLRASNVRMVAAARGIAQVSMLAVAAAALVALIGWVTNVEALKTVLPGIIPMNPVTAIAFLLAVAGLWILCRIEAGPGWRSRQVAHLIAVIVILIGAQRLIAYLMHWPWALDEWIFRARLGDNHMAPNTAWCFVMAGLALAKLDAEVGKRRARPSVWLALIPACIGLLAIAGSIYG